MVASPEYKDSTDNTKHNILIHAHAPTDIIMRWLVS